jgi:Glycerophosphoryl diester phosphodiesterase family
LEGTQAIVYVAEKPPSRSCTCLVHAKNVFCGVSIAPGVDMMGLDVRRTKDDVLVIVHDGRVDRTATGSGEVNAFALAQLKQLRPRCNSGGTMSPSSNEQSVPTLAEVFDRARSRIMLNLDMKEATYPETIAAAVDAGMANQVLLKKTLDADTPPLADEASYDRVPFQIMLGSRLGPTARIRWLRSSLARPRRQILDRRGDDPAEAGGVRCGEQRSKGHASPTLGDHARSGCDVEPDPHRRRHRCAERSGIIVGL